VIPTPDVLSTMNVMFIIAIVSLALQFATTTALLVLGQAPRWRRVRWFGAVAFTAGCYSTVDAIAALRAPGQADISWSLRLNLFIATLHGAAWLLFTYSGRDGQWQSIPPWVRRVVAVAVAIVGLGSASGLVAAPERAMLVVPQFGVSYERPVLSTLGNVLGLVPFLLLFIAMVGVWQERRRGMEGTTPVLVGFVLFLAAAVEELLVAAGVVPFIFLGDIGYVCVVVPVTLQLFRRFRDDADQLDILTEHLADEVQRRTEERDSAREQIIEQQRLAALGRQLLQRMAPARPLIALLPPPALLDDHGDVHAHQRADVGGQRAAERSHEDDLVRTGDAGHDLADTRVTGAREPVEVFEEGHLLRVRAGGNGVVRGIEASSTGRAKRLHRRTGTAVSGDGP